MDDNIDDDPYADQVDVTDDEPIRGLGELGDVTDDDSWCQVVEPDGTADGQ